ncbi:hypothetical protein ACFQ7O_00940 [Streptomyces sp. NPDC056485]|uniref:hypothetical protein n=1 Tax=Streptomyces sp. NPDC056485 TaxID=3345834 RepID=UPI00367C4D45
MAVRRLTGERHNTSTGSTNSSVPAASAARTPKAVATAPAARAANGLLPETSQVEVCCARDCSRGGQICWRTDLCVVPATAAAAS